MTYINGSTSVVAQEPKLVTKTPRLHVSPSLSNIEKVINSQVDFSQRNDPLRNQNVSTDKSGLGQAGVIEKFNQAIKNPQPNPKSVTGKENTVSEGADKLAENNNFRLAKEIDKLYPHQKVSLNNIDRLVVFGDSLSDSDGRMFEKSFHILPSYSQYYEGRFTNGFVWGEFLSSPAFLNKKMVNFAEGGSTAASYSPLTLRSNFLSNLDSQMKNYRPSDKDLIFFLFGANDYSTLHKNDILKVVESQIDGVEKLLTKGVKNVLVMGIPDLSMKPDSKNSDRKRQYKDIAIAHNHLLQKNIDALKEKYPEAKIFFFDIAGALNNIITVARKIGYDTTHSYTNHGYIHIPGTKDPQLNISPEYIFNDKVHPTQEVHHTFATILNHFIANNYADKAAA